MCQMEVDAHTFYGYTCLITVVNEFVLIQHSYSVISILKLTTLLCHSEIFLWDTEALSFL